MPRQIWEVAPHLCGYAPEIARRRLLLVLKVFIDESGKGDSPIFVMAGFLARAEQWARFDDEWRSILDEPPRIEAFHMSDSEWDGSRKRLVRLIDVIRRHVLTGVAVTVWRDDYESVFKGRVSGRLDRPYVLMHHSIMMWTLQWLNDNGIDEKVDFIFDEQKEESDYIQSIFTPMLAKIPAEMSRRFNNRPIHADDREMLGLQAADILAWSMRRVGHLARQGLPPDEFLTDLFHDIPHTPYHWDTNSLNTVLEGPRRRNLAAGRLFEHEIGAISRNLDVFITQFNHAKIRSAPEGQTISLVPIAAKETKRFRLVHMCPRADKPHLHRKATDECLAERTIATP